VNRLAELSVSDTYAILLLRHGAPVWEFLPRVLATNASQFTDAEVAAPRAAADLLRAVFWIDRADAVDNDARDTGRCD
jgi:hypothetical protein